MRSKMCSHRLQNSTKTSSPKITGSGKCTILRANEALVAFVYDQIQAPKCVKVSFAAPHYYNIQKEQPNLQKSERKKQNKLWQANQLAHTLSNEQAQNSQTLKGKEKAIIQKTHKLKFYFNIHHLRCYHIIQTILNFIASLINQNERQVDEPKQRRKQEKLIRNAKPKEN